MVNKGNKVKNYGDYLAVSIKQMEGRLKDMNPTSDRAIIIKRHIQYCNAVKDKKMF